MLRTRIPVIAAGLGLIAATAANAASAVGTITAIDETARTITLSDDMVYTPSQTMDLSRLKVGYTIRVSYTADAAGTNKVSVLEIILPAQPSGY
jgi:hypothetical protein